MQNSNSSFQPLFIQQGFIDLAYEILTFIDFETIKSIIDTDAPQHSLHKQNQTKKYLKNKQKTCRMYRMVTAYYFFKQYFNKADRSMHYSFYEDKQFLQIQEQQIKTLIITSSINQHLAQFSNFYQIFTNLCSQIQSSALLQFAELQQLKRILIDPSLPMPSIKRENEGMYCNSSFQHFLVAMRFPHQNQQQYFTPFEQFKQRMADQEQICFKNFFSIQKNKSSQMKTYENLHLVRYMPYEINCNNFKELLMEDNAAHNLIVYLFVLTDVWIDAVFTYVTFIHDPFFRFVELMSRYAAFRSFIIEIEQSMGFLFSSYQSLYSDTIRDSIFQSSQKKPKFCFWRPAMAKWFKKMSSIHEQTNKVYFFLLTKIREEKLLEKISLLTERQSIMKKYAICLKNNLQLNGMAQYMRQCVYEGKSGQTTIDSLVLNRSNDCAEALVLQYVEYIIDLAVNEETVHWCGHSQHRLGLAFLSFNQQFQLYNARYVKHLKHDIIQQFIHKQKSKTEKKKLLQSLIQYDMEFLQMQNVKAVMLRQFIEDINLKGKFFDDFDMQQNCNQQQMKDDIVQKVMTAQQKQKQMKITTDSGHQKQQEAGYSIKNSVMICFDFYEKDNKLKYFNEKARICQSIEGEEKYFFQIPSQLSPEQILTKSINTNDSSCNGQDDSEQSYEYISDQEEQSMSQTLISSQNTIKKCSIMIGDIEIDRQFQLNIQCQLGKAKEQEQARKESLKLERCTNQNGHDREEQPKTQTDYFNEEKSQEKSHLSCLEKQQQISLDRSLLQQKKDSQTQPLTFESPQLINQQQNLTSSFVDFSSIYSSQTQYQQLTFSFPPNTHNF